MNKKIFKFSVLCCLFMSIFFFFRQEVYADNHWYNDWTAHTYNTSSNNNQPVNGTLSDTSTTTSADDKEAEAAVAATGFAGAKTRLSVGTVFTDYGSGITYRVTKQASYRTLGEVEMVSLRYIDAGWGSDQHHLNQFTSAGKIDVFGFLYAKLVSRKDGISCWKILK